MTVLTTFTSMVGGIILASIGFWAYRKLKNPTQPKKSSAPTFTSATQAQQEKNTTTFTPASVEIITDTFRKIDDVFGEITVNGIVYTTFDAGEVLIYDKKQNPVVSFKVDGYGNEQRTINWIKVSKNVDKINGVIFYVKHNQNDFTLFNNWLNEQLYGGEYVREALKFQDLMEEIGKFNQLLASRKVRKGTGKYVAY